MQSIPFKTSDHVSFNQAIMEYIESELRLSSEQKDKISTSLGKLNEMRSEALSLEAHENTLDNMLRYYAHFNDICLRLNISENGVRIPFRWYGVFDGKQKSRPGRLFLLK